MAIKYPVKWMVESMRGAPQIAGLAGRLIAALDAFLLTGWGATPVFSITVSGGVGTATVTAGTIFLDHSVVAIDGVTSPASLNGEARVLSRTNNTIVFETDAPDGVASGSSMSMRYAPVGGWEKAFADTNRAAYRSIDPQSAGHYLYVDDTAAAHARVIGYEAMADINTGVAPFPMPSQINGGGYWYKMAATNTPNNVRYLLAADSRMLLQAIAPATAWSAAYTTSNVRGFGDAISLAPAGDPWITVLSALGVNTTQYSNTSLSGGARVDYTVGFTCSPRAISGLGTAVNINVSPEVGAGVSPTVSGADGFCGSAPSSVDGGVRTSRLFLCAPDNNTPRAIVPGVRYIPQTGLTSLVSMGSIEDGTGSLAGRKLYAVMTGASLGDVSGAAFVDITGPWRPQ